MKPMAANEVSVVFASEAKDTGRPTCPICGTPNPLNWMAAPDRFHGREKEFQLLRCSSCSMVWLDDPPTKAKMGEHYGPDYDRTISTAAQAPEHWFGRRDRVLALKPDGEAILDLGCATGGFLGTMKGLEWKLFGIEMSEEAASKARARCGAQVFVGDILDAPFPSQSFDVITCFNVFEHVYEPREVLVRVADWLKPGGVFFTLMPNIDSAGARIFRSYWYPLELPRHLYHFSPVSLRRVAQSAGLTEVYIKTHRELYFESSARFFFDDLLKRIGISRVPLAKVTSEPSLPWRILRKIFRLTILQMFTAAASVAGDGETIAAVFKKRDAAKVTTR